MGGVVTDIVIRKHLALSSFAMKRIVSTGRFFLVSFRLIRTSESCPDFSCVHLSTFDIGPGHHWHRGLCRVSVVTATCLAGSAAVAASPVVKEIEDMIESAYSHCKPAGFSLGIRSSNAMSNSGNGTVTSSVGSAFADGSTNYSRRSSNRSTLVTSRRGPRGRLPATRRRTRCRRAARTWPS
jgi:hypothetical protein